MQFLFDTCALSELVSRSPDLRARQNILALPREDVFFSVIVTGEIRAGIVKMLPSNRKTFLENWYLQHILALYRERTFLIDMDIAGRWGELNAELRKQKLLMSVPDALIAATALFHNLTVVTRNEKHFEHSGVPLYNPWK